MGYCNCSNRIAFLINFRIWCNSMNLKNIFFSGRRQKIRAKIVLAAQQQAYSNSLRNLRIAQLSFFIALIHIFLKK